jgi:hypothetical protein
MYRLAEEIGMAYMCEIGSGHRIYLDNQGTQTILTSMMGNLGQQQQSSSSMSTGTWTMPPEVYNTPHGCVVKIFSAQGEHFIQVQGSSMSSMSGAPALGQAQQMQMSPVGDVPGATAVPAMEPIQPMTPMVPMQPMTPLQPMQPIQPMKMGDMEMGMNPMEMRMGNMRLSMGSTTETSAKLVQRFCSQCGAHTEPEGRFCSSCGHKLA